jgi:peptidoglycan/LPS O-acetylase OafA/YrhL
MNAAAKPHLAELTSTRFFAAMAVVFGHFLPFGIPDWLVTVTGAFGVSFFFVLSGFILCYVYRDVFASGVAAAAYRRFMVARLARVYPCYVLALLLITGLYLALSSPLPPNAVTSWLANLLALQTFAPSYETQQNWNSPAWSISTEIVFYAICPLILAAVSRHARDRTTLVGLVLLTIGYALLAHTVILILVLERGLGQAYWLDLMAARNIVWRLPEFVMGVLAASFLYEGHLPGLARAGVRNAVLVACIVAVFILNLAPWPQWGSTPAVIMREYRVYVGYMIPFTVIITVLAAGPTFLSPLLAKRWMVFLGEISYAIYIYHWIAWAALASAYNSGNDVRPWAAPAIALVVAFSAASYLWYERPMRRWIRAR